MDAVCLKKTWLFLLLALLGWPGMIWAKTAESTSCRAVEVDIRAVLGIDDLAGAGLEEAIGASLRYLAKLPAAKNYNLCDRQVSVAELKNSLKELRSLWRTTGGGREFSKRLAEGFVLLAVQKDDQEKKVMITGYFEPMLEGALHKETPFLYPLYPVPTDLVQKGGEVGRLDGGRLVPYWTRGEIEEQNLLAGQELVYLNDPVEAFILQVQGSGRVRLRDGSVRRLQYGAKNGRPYRSIGKFLVERGAMGLDEVTLPTISAYLKAHPDEAQEILQYNESFVFFRWGNPDQAGPLGSLGEPLTPERSVALDRECFPPGAPAFLFGRKPKFNDKDEIIGWSKMQRLVFNQDSGSAIRGPGRLDLFLGCGARARATAGVLKGQGRLYFLLKKKK
jgi:membrane-bound lytic murein transglycosylase A